MTLYVIVLYNCIYKYSKTYTSFLRYVDEEDVFVFDNSKQKQFIDDECHYVHCPENKGLSYAYNQAALYAREKGYDWMLILDQDTTFPIGANDAYNKAVETYSDIVLFAPKHKISSGKYMSPVPFKYKRGCLQNEVPQGVVELLPYAPINSGILVRLEAFEMVGGYEEGVKLDFSDICFVEKLSKHYKEFYVLDFCCEQDFSEEVIDIDSLKRRFSIYCECASNYPKYSFFDRLSFFYIVTRHCIKLLLKTKRLSFVKLYFRRFLFS